MRGFFGGVVYLRKYGITVATQCDRLERNEFCSELGQKIKYVGLKA
jgi:hypothetical protein